MATYGLQTWDESGNVLIDHTTFLAKFLGVIVVDTQTGSLTVPEFALGVPWFYAEVFRDLESHYVWDWYDNNLGVSLTPTGLAWSRSSAYGSVRVHYGIR